MLCEQATGAGLELMTMGQPDPTIKSAHGLPLYWSHISTGGDLDGEIDDKMKGTIFVETPSLERFGQRSHFIWFKQRSSYTARAGPTAANAV
jgi:hypothetical protein